MMPSTLGRSAAYKNTYYSWRAMRKRCLCPTDPAFPRYGGCGLTVCSKWATFVGFLADMGRRPQGTTLHRLDNTLGYDKANCVWGTKEEQESCKSTSRYITIGNATKTVTQWARLNGLRFNVIVDRIEKYGWDPVRAATEPAGPRPCRLEHQIAANGQTLSVSEWARQTGLARVTIRDRIRRGWAPELAVTTPVQK